MEGSGEFFWEMKTWMDGAWMGLEGNIFETRRYAAVSSGIRGRSWGHLSQWLGGIVDGMGWDMERTMGVTTG